MQARFSRQVESNANTPGMYNSVDYARVDVVAPRSAATLEHPAYRECSA
jgi:hypothetical protein